MEALRRAERVHRVVVFSDCPEVCRIAREQGAEVPVPRPPELSDDRTSSLQDAAQYVITRLREQEPDFDYNWLAFGWATAPLVEAADFDAAIAQLEQARQRHPDLQAGVALAETDYVHHYVNTATLDAEQRITWPFGPPLQPRERMPRAYHLATAFYIVSVHQMMTAPDNASAFTSHALGYVLPPEKLVDIDTPLDLERLQALRPQA
jgi:CMP-N-acetylneuraminic acid synthetase